MTNRVQDPFVRSRNTQVQREDNDLDIDRLPWSQNNQVQDNMRDDKHPDIVNRLRNAARVDKMDYYGNVSKILDKDSDEQENAIYEEVSKNYENNLKSFTDERRKVTKDVVQALQKMPSYEDLIYGKILTFPQKGLIITFRNNEDVLAILTKCWRNLKIAAVPSYLVSRNEASADQTVQSQYEEFERQVCALNTGAKEFSEDGQVPSADVPKALYHLCDAVLRWARYFCTYASVGNCVFQDNTCLDTLARDQSDTVTQAGGGKRRLRILGRMRVLTQVGRSWMLTYNKRRITLAAAKQLHARALAKQKKKPKR